MSNETPKKKAKNSIWSIQGFEKRCRELILAGALNSDNGLSQLCETLTQEFSEQLKENGLRVSQEAVSASFAKLIWTDRVQKELKRAIRHRLSLDDFRRDYFSYIPEKMWLKKAKLFKGLSNLHAEADFVAGVGRLITEELGPNADRFELPLNDFEHPFTLEGEDWNIPVINAANIGIMYDPNIEDNPFRRALADAQRRNALAVVVTNGIDLYVKKTAGVMHIYRAQVSGIHIKLEHLPESYRAEAARILKERRDDEVVYQNIAAKFLGLLDALHKISHRQNNRGPEFGGRVLYVLGYKEEEIVNEAANAELRYITVKKQNQLNVEIRVLRRKISDAEKIEDYKEVKRLSARLEQLSQELAMVILTNVSDEDRNRHRRRIRALLVKKLQEVIPNCTVISQGSAHLKIGEKRIKIHIPSNIEVSDGQLASYGDRYGADVFNDRLADITIVCHPYALNSRLVGRKDSKDGQPVTKFVHVAPICVDDVFLREQLRDMTKKVHPIQQCVFDPQFKPGVLVVSCSNGMVHADSLPIAKLGRFNAVRDMSNFAYAYPETKYITCYVNTDNHFGSRSKRYVWDPKNQTHLGLNEAAIEMMRRSGIINPNDMPVHLTAEMDDATNGDMWFSPRYRPSPQEMSIIRFEGWLQKMTDEVRKASEAGDHQAVLNLTEEIKKVSIGQLYFRGEDFPFHQMMQVYDRHIDPNVDLYSAVLGRSVKSGLIIRGISEINKTIMDTRDVGVHNFPNGNHRIGTLEQKDLEGEYLARQLRAKLAQLPRWRGQEDFLEKMVRAPRFGNETFCWGTVQAPGRYTWGLRFHGAPARLSSWSDLLSASVKSDLARGDDTFGLLKHVTLTLFGDKHFYCKAETPRIVYVMCAAGTHTDLYGSSGGFPPNNTGVMFVSIPADGPDAGPILVRMLPHDLLRDWFANPKPFNWKKFLPKAV